jgi:hypothetical protein
MCTLQLHQKLTQDSSFGTCSNIHCIAQDVTIQDRFSSMQYVSHHHATVAGSSPAALLLHGGSSEELERACGTLTSHQGQTVFFSSFAPNDLFIAPDRSPQTAITSILQTLAVTVRSD